VVFQKKIFLNKNNYFIFQNDINSLSFLFFKKVILLYHCN